MGKKMKMLESYRREDLKAKVYMKTPTFKNELNFYVNILHMFNVLELSRCSCA